VAERGPAFAARRVPVAGPGVDRHRGGGRLHCGGLRADRRRPSAARRARQAAGRGGSGRAGFDVAGAAGLEFVAVGARAFGAAAALTLGARGSGHSVYAAGPVGVIVPEPVGSGAGAVRVVDFGFCVVVGVPLGVAVAFRVAVVFEVCVAVAVCFVFEVAVAVAVCVILVVGFLLAINLGFLVSVVGFLLTIDFGFVVRVGVRAGFAVRADEIGG
jgi:hypothetical protein